MIIQGDCLVAMREMGDKSIDFIVTDPPYGLKFMGKQWDHGIPGVAYWAEMLRICKPGSMLAAFGGTRTFHRLTCAIEDAGWVIRDCISYLYGSGFPKSHNKFGLEGYGTALKPAWEPIILAMKPLDGTYAQNVEKWGVGGMNIDESRIQSDEIIMNHSRSAESAKSKGKYGDSSSQETHQTEGQKLGRWPANLILDEEAAQMLDQQTGSSKSSDRIRRNNPRKGSSKGADQYHEGKGFNVSGDASRFFYCAKASSSERNAGLEGIPLKESGAYGEFEGDGRGRQTEHQPRANNHPTVKPLALMRYIIKLLAPPNDPILLDPFAGSGSTLCAAKQLSIRAIGIELDPEYCEIANKRGEYYKRMHDAESQKPNQTEMF